MDDDSVFDGHTWWYNAQLRHFENAAGDIYITDKEAMADPSRPYIQSEAVRQIQNMLPSALTGGRIDNHISEMSRQDAKVQNFKQNYGAPPTARTIVRLKKRSWWRRLLGL